MSSYSQPLLKQFATTNGPSTVSNIIASIASSGGRTNWSVASITNAGTAAYSNATAFALAQSGTIVTQNNSFAVVLSNAWKMDAAHALSLSNLTASRIVLSGVDNGLASAAASGSVQVNADGSATTFAQVNALAPGFVVTNGNNNVTVIFTNNGVSLSVNSSGVFILTNYVAAGLGFRFNTNGSSVATSGMTNNGVFDSGSTGTDGALYMRRTSDGVLGAYVKNSGAETRLGNDWGGGFTTLYAGGASICRANGTGFGVLKTPAVALDVLGSAAISGTTTSTNGFLMPTNYVAANFTPVAGHVLIVASNGVLWKVTQLTTNLLSANTP